MANPTSKINLVINGTTTQLDIHDADAVPRTGGAVMTGSSLGRTINNSELKINGGTSESNGSAILLRGKDKSENGGETDIVANDGTDSTTVNIKPNGTITRVTNNVTKNFAMQEDVNTLLSGKANSSHTHAKSEITDFPSYGTTANTICEGNDSRLSDARTPTAHTHTKSEITDFPSYGTTSGTICEGNDSRLSDARTPTAHNHSASEITSGTLDSARIPNLDASKITSGTIDIDRLPAGALERLVVVADQTARYALTTSSVQLGDTVKQLDTGIMYYVVDTSKLNSADGYSEYTAGSATSVPWSGVTSKPSSFTPSSHTHTTSDITDFPTLATVATSGSYNDLSNKPTIPTYSAGSNLSLNDTTFNVSSTPSFTSITVSGYTITVD